MAPILDGTEKITPTPFDAHEQVVRGPHSYSPSNGYEKADPVVTLDEKGDVTSKQEYPKAIAHDEKTGEPVIAKSAEHEAELKAVPVDPGPGPAPVPEPEKGAA